MDMAAPVAHPGGVSTATPLAARPWFKTSQRVLGRDWAVAYVFIAPMVLLLFGLVGYPLVLAFKLSFYSGIGDQVEKLQFAGIQNFINLWTDSRFINAVRITLLFTFWSVFVKFLLGLGTALTIHHLPRWGAILGGIVLVPYIIPDVVRAIAWKILLNPLFGAGNFLLKDVFHITDRGYDWMGSAQTALPSVTMVNIWSGAAFFIILLVAGLKAIDSEQYDAAAVDGASVWRRFLHITLPGLRYVIIVATLLSTIFTFNSFTLTYLLTQGGPAGATKIYTIFAYEFVAGNRYGPAASVAVTTAPLLFVLVLVLGRYMMQTDEQRTSGDNNIFWRSLMLILSPFALLLKGLLWLFWGINEIVERAVGAVTSRIRPAGSMPLFSRRTHRRIRVTFLYLVMGVILLFSLLPFYIIFVTAFKSKQQITAATSGLEIFWPHPWTLDQFYALFQRPFLDWYQNTIIIAVTTTLVSVIVASLGAYGLIRLKWRGSSTVGTTVLIAYLMPSVLLVIPLYGILQQMRQIIPWCGINSQCGLIMVYPSVVLPFATWLMMSYYRSIPEEIEDAAMIDGCNRFQAFWHVIWPLTRPAALAVGMFAVTQAWNEFLYAFTFLNSDKLTTLSVGLGRMIVGDVQPWGELTAAALLMAIPVVIVYVTGQKFMVAGLTAGSVKG